MNIENAGENALLVTLGDHMDPMLLEHIRSLVTLIDTESPSWLVDLVPAPASLLVLFDPTRISRTGLRRYLRERMGHVAPQRETARIVELPVYYPPVEQLDLLRVARHTECDPKEIIALHQSTEYRVYAMGFAPGFAYLGELPVALATPRLESPRSRVPSGAVGIADRQTAVYPTAGPGGWNLIGLCPLTLFNPASRPATIWQVGDRVRIRAIEKDEYLTLDGELP